jgi:hypothetical protein
VVTREKTKIMKLILAETMMVVQKQKNYVKVLKGKNRIKDMYICLQDTDTDVDGKEVPHVHLV